MDTTFAELFRLIIGNVNVADISEAFSRVAFVNFNYDRCLEQFFFTALMQYSGLDTAEAAKHVSGLKVLHPYGWIGPLSWMTGDEFHGTRVTFGSELYAFNLLEQAMNIRTFSEERGSEEDAEIRAVMAEARQLVFLGCAFHPQNLKLIQPDENKIERAYGTCYMVPSEDKFASPPMETFAIPTARAFYETLANWRRTSPRMTLAERQVNFEPLTCRQLVGKYGGQWTSRV
jgi:hypothetical protein